MRYDRSTTMAARRGGHRPGDADRLQADYAKDIRSDMAREGLSLTALAGKIGIKPGTLKGYLDGGSPWPFGTVRELARLLGRSLDADLVTLGYQSAPMGQRFLRLDQQVRVAQLVQKSALLRRRDPLADSPGAQLFAATLLTSLQAQESGVDLRLVPLSRGRKKRRPFFADLLIVDFPGKGLDMQQARQRLLDLRVRDWPGQGEPTFSNALDYYEAMVEEGADYQCATARGVRH